MFAAIDMTSVEELEKPFHEQMSVISQDTMTEEQLRELDQKRVDVNRQAPIEVQRFWAEKILAHDLSPGIFSKSVFFFY